MKRPLCHIRGKNPLLAEERARKREDLLQATEAALTKLTEQIARGTGPKQPDKIARAVGRIPVSRTKPWPQRAWSAPIRASPASSAPFAA